MAALVNQGHWRAAAVVIFGHGKHSSEAYKSSNGRAEAAAFALSRGRAARRRQQEAVRSGPMIAENSARLLEVRAKHLRRPNRLFVAEAGLSERPERPANFEMGLI